jgi:hypothetical protein
MTDTQTIMNLAERMAVAVVGNPDAVELIEARATLHAAVKKMAQELEAAKAARDTFENHFLEVSRQYCNAAATIAKAEKQEPYAVAYEYDGPFGMHQSFTYKYRNGKYPDRSFNVYRAAGAAQKENT